MASLPAVLNSRLGARVVADIGVVPTMPSAPRQSPSRPVGGAVDRPTAPPVRLRIPRIDVDTVLTELQIQGDGHLEAPADPDHAGWWSRGPSPGSPGAAVIVGHVDSTAGPAVFYGLADLRPGDAIEVDEADGSTVGFTVQALRNYPKADFPDDLVYGAVPTPALRLITCGGSYDRHRHGYQDNLVVFAEPTPRGGRSTDPPSAPPSGSTP